MNKAQKIEKLDDLKESFKSAKGIFITDYRSLTVTDMTVLRLELRKSQTSFRVVKNRMAIRALKELGVEGVDAHFDNTTAVALAKGDVAAAAKALTEFAKKKEQLKFKGAYVEGQAVAVQDIKALASLPSKEAMLASLLGTLNNVPAGFVRVLHAVPQTFAYVLEAIRKQKEEKGDAN